MAHFQCTSCGYRQDLSDEFLHRRARCPECQSVRPVEDDSSIETTNRRDEPRRLRDWWGVMVCGVAATIVIVGVWESFTKSPAKSGLGSTANSDLPANKSALSAAQSNRVSNDSQATLLQLDREATTASNQLTSLGSQQPGANRDEEEVQREFAPQISNESKNDSLPSHQEIAAGRLLFEHQWKPNDPLAGPGDGLGPVFNGHSCVECHFQGGTGGSGTNAHNVESFEVLASVNHAKSREGIIHAASVDPSMQESKVHLTKLLGAPQVPFRQFRPRQPITTVPANAIRSVAINTPALWGNGLIDQITDEDLRQIEAAQPSRGYLRLTANGHYGKFGWKAQIATLSQFVGSACAAELGLSNAIRSQQKPLAYIDDVQAQPDLTDDQLAALTLYVAGLPAPQQILPTGAVERERVQAGAYHFITVGCAKCHVKDVGPAHGVYSDFRMHLIDTAVTRGQTYYEVNAEPVYDPAKNDPRLGEWKTPALWGLADSAPYWHDGTAQTIRAAIVRHEEAGEASKNAFLKLAPEHQDELLDFLNTLRAPSTPD